MKHELKKFDDFLEHDNTSVSFSLALSRKEVAPLENVQ